MALKIRLAHGVLRDEPCCLRSVSVGSVFCGPAMLGDQLSEARSILDVDSLHAGDVGAAELACVEKFLAYAQVLRLHFKQFAPEILINHEFIL